MDALGMAMLTFGSGTFVLGVLVTVLYFDIKGGR